MLFLCKLTALLLILIYTVVQHVKATVDFLSLVKTCRISWTALCENLIFPRHVYPAIVRRRAGLQWSTRCCYVRFPARVDEHFHPHPLRGISWRTIPSEKFKFWRIRGFHNLLVYSVTTGEKMWLAVCLLSSFL